jgi:hypothetical protein
VHSCWAPQLRAAATKVAHVTLCFSYWSLPERALELHGLYDPGLVRCPSRAYVCVCVIVWMCACVYDVCMYVCVLCGPKVLGLNFFNRRHMRKTFFFKIISIDINIQAFALSHNFRKVA